MKKLYVLTLFVLFCISATLPPALPSSFYGWVTGTGEGQIVEVWANNVKLAQTTIFLYQGAPVYALNVPIDGITEGTAAQFKIGGVVSGIGYLHTGTNVRLDLVYIFSPPVISALAPTPKPVCVIRNPRIKHPSYCYSRAGG